VCCFKQVNGKRLSDSSIRSYIQAVRGFLNWCSKEDGLDELVSEKTASRIELPRVEHRLITTFTSRTPCTPGAIWVCICISEKTRNNYM
jgi:hypothetical protein